MSHATRKPPVGASIIRIFDCGPWTWWRWSIVQHTHSSMLKSSFAISIGRKHPVRNSSQPATRPHAYPLKCERCFMCVHRLSTARCRCDCCLGALTPFLDSMPLSIHTTRRWPTETTTGSGGERMRHTTLQLRHLRLNSDEKRWTEECLLLLLLLLLLLFLLLLFGFF
jgi:hypothetical protein